MGKKFYVAIAAGILAIGGAQAVTVDDLVQYGGDAIEIFYGNYKERSLHSYVNGYVHFEKVNDNTVVLKNYYGLCDVPFTLKDNKLIMAYTEDDDNPTNILEVESSKYAFMHLTPQTAVNQTYYSQNGLCYTSATILKKTVNIRSTSTSLSKLRLTMALSAIIHSWGANGKIFTPLWCLSQMLPSPTMM